jgi:hypothetical protein
MFRELDSEIYRIMESLITFFKMGIKNEINELSGADISYLRLTNKRSDNLPFFSQTSPSARE